MEQILRTECPLPLSEAQIAKLCAFKDALLVQNRVMNLTAITQPEAVARLHFLDSLALLQMADFHEKKVIDVGCGAGFPGVPLKIAEPTIRLTLLDSTKKRIAWLDQTLAKLEVCAACVAARAEEFGERARYDIAVSRAVARLNMLAELCLPLVRVGGIFLAMKGAAADEELSQARSAIELLGGKIEQTVQYEISGAKRGVVIVRKISQTPPAFPRRYSLIKQKPL